MDNFLSSLPNLRPPLGIRIDQFDDRLNHIITVYMLVFFAILVGLKEFAGEPLNCYGSSKGFRFTQSHANAYCWNHKLYRFPSFENLTELLSDNSSGDELVTGGRFGRKRFLNSSIVDREVQTNSSSAEVFENLEELHFYRWITIIFIVQALLFKLPNLLWMLWNEYSGTQIEKMVTLIDEVNFEDIAKRDQVFTALAKYVIKWIKLNARTSTARRALSFVGARSDSENFLSGMYLIVKTLYLINIIMQFVLLTLFLKLNFWTYGSITFEIYAGDTDSAGEQHFPIVALCHFQLLEQRKWLQCLISINSLVDKLFAIEWFWLLILLSITSIRLFVWIYRNLSPHATARFVRRYLPKKVYKDIENMLNRLQVDGVFLLRILATNTNDVAMERLIRKLNEMLNNPEDCLDQGGEGEEARLYVMADNGSVTIRDIALQPNDSDIALQPLDSDIALQPLDSDIASQPLDSDTVPVFTI